MPGCLDRLQDSVRDDLVTAPAQVDPIFDEERVGVVSASGMELRVGVRQTGVTLAGSSPARFGEF